MKDIFETLAEDGSFSTLIAALNTTGLADRLKEAGPFTFFAPNDEAFRRVNVDEMARDKGTFTNILLYHLMTGRMMSSEIGAHESLYTECGKSLTVHLQEGQPVIDNAKYVKPDLECSNGVVHVIDNVFMPQFSGWYCGCC